MTYNANRLYAGLDADGEVKLFRVVDDKLEVVTVEYWSRVTEAWRVDPDAKMVALLEPAKP